MVSNSLHGQPIWLSNRIPADAERSIKPAGMHHLASESKGRGKVKIVQWLMQGERVEDAAYFVQDSTTIEALVFAPSGKKVEHKLDSLNQRTILSFSNPEEGFYNEYVVIKKVSGDTLYYAIAKGELLNHSCRNGHAHVREMMPYKVYPQSIPFEIVRKRMVHEDFHYFVSSGEEISYSILLNGEPANGILTKLSTEKGWINSRRTDDSGEVSFQFLQDYFTPWQEINNREEYTYVLFAKTTIPEIGVFEGLPYNYIKYTASISDAYRPAKTFYQSMFWSIIVLLLTTIGTILAVYYYRSRRNRPFKEIIFDEAN
ncbi:MAG: hypothetical protein DRI71_02870 [Bacteroidetes bacterium]|nr:MAG: hypothetical protein DRI71_02870 [Bacteroidota bacterium]